MNMNMKKTICKAAMALSALLCFTAGAVTDPTYKVTVKEGTEDAANWTIDPAVATNTGVKAGTTITAAYAGAKRVKSVKAKKKAAASLIVNPEVGQIIGSDGTNYEANATLPTGVKAVAKICYVGSDNGEDAPYNHGLALALSDASTGCEWSTSTGSTVHTYYTTSRSFASESGLQYNATHNSDTYPAFKAAIANNGTTAPTGCSSWFLASGYQWQKMIGATGLSNLGLQGSVNYWSSTEYNATYAWRFYSGNGDWDGSNKGLVSRRVRACLAF